MSGDRLLQAVTNADCQDLFEQLRILESTCDDVSREKAISDSLLCASNIPDVDESCFKILLNANGANVCSKDIQGRSLLSLAIQNCLSCDIIKNILIAGADIDSADHCGRTALMYCCIFDHPEEAEIVETLIERGARVDLSNDFGYTCLTLALEFSKSNRIFEQILKTGVDMNVLDFQHKTPLMYAIQKVRDVRIIRKMLAAGADVHVVDDQGRTPLMMAIWHSQEIEMVKTLLEFGADVNAKDNMGYTALMEAIYLPRAVDIVKTLLDCGADANVVNSSGYSILTSAIYSNKNIEIINYLLGAGADINFVRTTFDERHETALLLAIERGSIEICEALIDHGAHISFEMNAAIFKGYDNIVEKMIQHEAVPELCDMHEINETVTPVLKRWADWPFSAVENLSPLFAALFSNNLYLSKLFVQINFLHERDLYPPPELLGFLYSYLDNKAVDSELETLTFARNTFSAPWPLKILCSSMISRCVGFESNREQKLSLTGLPKSLQRYLKFEINVYV